MSLSWRGLLLGLGAAEAAGLAMAAIALGDPEAYVFTALFGAAVAWLAWRPGRLVTLAIGLLSANVAFWMLPALVTTVRHSPGRLSLGLVVTAVLTPAAGGGVLAAGVLLLRGRAKSRRSAVPALVALGLALVVPVLVGIGVVVGADSSSAALQGDAEAEAGTGAVAVVSENMRFSTDQLAVPAGVVTFSLRNNDLFWHSITVDELGLDLWVPVRGDLSATVQAPAGRYEFYCRVPGHAAAGMRGTLTVG